jgi:hypothetical protein
MSDSPPDGDRLNRLDRADNFEPGPIHRTQFVSEKQRDLSTEHGRSSAVFR